MLGYLPLDWLPEAIPIPGYYVERKDAGLGSFTFALLAIAFLSVVLRTMVVTQLSKIWVLLLPLALMLVGYAIDLSSSVAYPGALTIGVIILLITDLFAYLVAQAET